MAYSQVPAAGGGFGAKLGRALVRILVTLALLALGGFVLLLLSEKNAKTFSVAVEGDQLLVMKGRMFPRGSEPFRPSDPALADAYGPLPLDGPAPNFVGQQFEDRDALDRALFAFIAAKAEPMVLGEDPARLQKGLELLRRARRLTGLTEDQRITLKRLEAEVAYYQGRTKIQEALVLFVEGLGQLKLAADSQSRHARTAAGMLSVVEVPAKVMEEALRAAVHSLNLPAPTPKPAETAPSPAPLDSEKKDAPAPAETEAAPPAAP